LTPRRLRSARAKLLARAIAAAGAGLKERRLTISEYILLSRLRDSTARPKTTNTRAFWVPS
jgi:hypothetical protein